MRRWLESAHRVVVLEPFHAYHHQEFTFFPDRLPPFIEQLIESGRIDLIEAARIHSRSLYPEAAERAVAAVERVYPAYRSQVEPLVGEMVRWLGSDAAEDILKKWLCDKLAVFFSVNLTLRRAFPIMAYSSVLVHMRIDVPLYRRLEALADVTGLPDVFRDSKIRFTRLSERRAVLKSARNGMWLVVRLLGQFLGALGVRPSVPRSCRRYRFGFTVLAPKRQFRRNRRGPSFLIDETTFRRTDTVMIPLVPLRPNQIDALKRFGSDVAFPPAAGRFFDGPRIWARLLTLTLTSGWRRPEEMKTVASSVFHYQAWKHLLQRVLVRHFITHSDFSYTHIARNIALKQCGVRTWYFTDASNFGLNFREDDTCWFRHPFWCYLHYDRFLTWSWNLADYFRRHPGTAPETEVIGCIWAQHIPKVAERDRLLNSFFEGDRPDAALVVSAFTSTYTVNGITSHMEAVVFIEHLGRLIDVFSDVVLLIKEKKSREFLSRLEHRNGGQLISMLDRLGRHPRVRVLSPDTDASNVIGAGDLCVSFPFTSTTFEALSAARAAIWHDPLEFYRNTPYAQLDGVVTHGYAELEAFVDCMRKEREAGTMPGPIADTPLLDPYRDGKALDRFRNHLLNSDSP